MSYKDGHFYYDEDKAKCETLYFYEAGGYEWDSFIIAKDLTTGLLHWETDSGCSCNSPFEEVSNIKDLPVISATTAKDFVKDFKRIYMDDTERAAEWEKVTNVLRENGVYILVYNDDFKC